MEKNISRFTLVEILAVAAIIGILAGIALGITSYVGQRNREVQTQTTIKMLETIVEQYKNKYGAYPALNGKPGNTLGTEVFRLPATPGKNDLVALFQDISYDGTEITGIKGVNIAKVGNDIIILDGWGSPVLYVYPGVFNKTKVDFVSAGADKKLGDGGSASVLEIKNGSISLPPLGSRTAGDYFSHAGKGDDFTNFKRTDN